MKTSLNLVQTKISIRIGTDLHLYMEGSFAPPIQYSADSSIIYTVQTSSGKGGLKDLNGDAKDVILEVFKNTPEHTEAVKILKNVRNDCD